MITKSFIRKSVLHYRRLISIDSYLQRNRLLCDRVKSLVSKCEPVAIHSFLAIEKNREPNLQSLFSEFWSQDINIMVSKTDFGTKEMSHYYLHGDVRLSENHLGIPEPTGDLEEARLNDVDLMFIPLLLADKKGHRIGYGGGFYDRLLEETNFVKVGLSLSPPVDEIQQKEDWDIPLDYLITPFKTYNYG